MNREDREEQLWNKMKCPACKKFMIPVKVGATIGAGQLTACPCCGVVLCEAAIKPEEERKQY